MKKVMGFLAVTAAVIGFAACGGDDSANETGTAAGILAAQLEEKGAAEGYAIDIDCAIKKLVTLSVEDLTLMSENIDFEGDDLTEFGASEKAENNIYQTKFGKSQAIIMGSEGKGLSSSVIKLCDELISIPLHGKIESLNVSVACGTILFEMIRQKKY